MSQATASLVAFDGTVIADVPVPFGVTLVEYEGRLFFNALGGFSYGTAKSTYSEISPYHPPKPDAG